MDVEPSTLDATGDSGERPLFTLRRERRMTRTHAVLWGTILITTAADILFTVVGLANGLREGDAVVGHLAGGRSQCGDDRGFVSVLGHRLTRRRGSSGSRRDRLR